MRPPGFEPGSPAWKAGVLPLDYGRANKPLNSSFKRFHPPALVYLLMAKSNILRAKRRKRAVMSKRERMVEGSSMPKKAHAG